MAIDFEAIRFWLFVASEVFQASGAILLLVFTFSTKREMLVRNFVQNSFSVLDADTKTVEYNHSVFANQCINSYASKVAVLLILFGFLFSLWGDIGTYCRWKAAIAVVSITIVLVMIIINVLKILVPKLNKVKQPIAFEELNDLEIETNMSSILSEEIDGLFDIDGEENNNLQEE